MLCYDQVKIKCDLVIFRFLSRIRNVDWKGVRGMDYTKPTPGLTNYEKCAKNRNPRAYELALRLMDAAAELDVSAEEFDSAIDYIRWWAGLTGALHVLTMAEVKSNRDAFFEAL